MKAKLINEIQNFTRGQDSKDALDLGGIERQKNKLENLSKSLESIGIVNNFQEGTYDRSGELILSLYFSQYHDYYIQLSNENGRWEYILGKDKKHYQNSDSYKILIITPDHKEMISFIKKLYKETLKKNIQGLEKNIKTTQNKIVDIKNKIKNLEI